MNLRVLTMLTIAVAVQPLSADDAPKPKPPATPEKSPAEDPEKLREAIVRDMLEIEKKLKDSDAGEATRSLQKRVLENLDKLLERSRDQPPQNDSDRKNQPDAQNGPGSPPTADGRESTRRTRQEARRRRGESAASASRPQKAASSRPSPGAAGTGDQTPEASTPRPDAAPAPMPQLVKDVWGHLPESMRQEIDRYYRMQFMPRYRDLIEQYYLRLAESEKRRKD